MIIQVVLYLITGVLSGLLAGLLGIGGGMVTIPALTFIFYGLDVPPEYLMHLVIGTSLASMIFNTLSSSFSHFRRHNIILKVVGLLVPGCLLGAVIGPFLAKILPSDFLQTFFGAFAVYMGSRMMIRKKKMVKEAKMPHWPSFLLYGLGIGTLSTMLGVGGGLMTVPLLTHFGVEMKKSVGSSSLLSFFITLIGAVAFLIFGEEAPPIHDAVGFIYLPAFFIIAFVSFLFAPLGVKLTHKLPTKRIRQIFGVILIIAGLMMIYH